MPRAKICAKYEQYFLYHILRMKSFIETEMLIINTIKKVIKTIFRLYKNYRPMNFFGGISLILLLLSGILFLPVLFQYFHTGLVPNFPTLIVSGFIALTAVLFFLIGLILSTVVEKDRQQYEFRLQVLEQVLKNDKTF